MAELPAVPDSQLRVPADAVLRTNPAYQLVAMERLPRPEREQLAGAGPAGEVYGALRPASGSGLPTTLVSPDTALLLLSLAHPGPVPAYLAADDDAGAALARLVLDRLLEIQVGGEFVTGPPACDALRTGPSYPGSDHDPEHPLSRLSIQAIRHAAALASADTIAVAARLYCYHRQPLTPRWAQRLATERDRERFLGIGAGRPAGRLLQRHWHPATEKSTADGWYGWRHRGWRSDSHGQPLRYKLYVSPVTDALPDMLETFVQVATEAEVPAFKLGRSPVGLLRPDKLVAYFSSYDDLAGAAAQLRPAVAGWPGQGVPFTGVIDPAGLLSWGLDPPPRGSAQAAGALDSPTATHQSWRMWVALRLARALLSAQPQGDRQPAPWRFALDRLRADGVDTTTWAPSRDPWKD